MKGCNDVNKILEQHILTLLEKNERLCGFDMTQKIKALTKEDFNITEGALYPILYRLEAKNIIAVAIEEIDNRIRKYYSLTQDGNKESIKYCKHPISLNYILPFFLKPKYT